MSIRKQLISAMKELGMFTQEQLENLLNSISGDREDKESILSDLAEHEVFLESGNHYIYTGKVA